MMGNPRIPILKLYIPLVYNQNWAKVPKFQSYTVIIFLARNGRIRAVKFRRFRPKNFGRISFDLGKIFPNQQILRLNNGRNSPKSEKIRPKFSRRNLTVRIRPFRTIFAQKKITVYSFSISSTMTSKIHSALKGNHNNKFSCIFNLYIL
jgi:hypothetical protein